MTALYVAELADRLALSSDDVVVVVGEPEQLAAALDELLEELEVALEDEARSSVHVAAESAASLLDALAGLEPDTAAVVTGIESLPVAEFAVLDAGRNRLLGRADVVILTTARGAALLARHAPNWWSWVGDRQWTLRPPPSEHPAEVRLRGLREATGLDDAEVVRRAEAGELPVDPVFAEWLALLGRGDLVGQ